MTEKGSPILLILALGLLYWASIPTAPDPTQCDLTDLTPFIEEVAKVEFFAPPKELDPMPSPLIFVPRHEIDPMPSPSDKHKKTKREILIFVSKNCPPCEKWKRCEMQRFMDAGWAVGIVEVHSYQITPTFEIESGDKKVILKGYTTLEQAGEAVR
jgi:hypothetical protein